MTWFASGIPTVLVFLSPQGEMMTGELTWAIAFLLFGACFLVITRTKWHPRALLCIASALGLTVSIIGRSGFEPILLVIVAAVGGGLLSISGYALLIATQTLLLACIKLSMSGAGALPSVGAYAGFMIFAAMTAMIAENEKRARADLAEANIKLMTALSLLDVSTRAAERIRIGRDLHDVIGHHLAALCLQLEVASHVPADECAEHVTKAQSISKLLLGDVRSVVSDLRAEEPIDLIRALELLASAITKPQIEVIAPDCLLVQDPGVAQTVIRCLQEVITNATRHSLADSLTIRIREVDDSLEIEAADDGAGVSKMELGNGLLGMRERIDATGGTLELRSAPGEGFVVDIRLPLGDSG